METISKPNVKILTDLLAAYGVRRAVVSPGSRNAPLTVALDRCSDICCTTVIDERAAAFAGLGMAMRGEPTALVCTSGTALLNYAPAVAEAYYSRIPLIVISADRPAEWTDQRDSQTIRQNGALASIVRRSVEVPDDMPAAFANRLINDALTDAIGDIPGPVHINMPLCRPLTAMCDSAELPDGIKVETLRACRLDESDRGVRTLFERLNVCSRIMVVSGSHRGMHIPEALASNPSVAVIAEVNANTGDSYASPTLFDGCDIADEYRPDIIVSLGGALISDGFKGFLRSCKAEVISVGYDDCIVDTFRASRLVRAAADADDFLRRWAGAMNSHCESSYRSMWAALASERRKAVSLAVGSSPWSDLKAVGMLAEALAPESMLFIANGMSARYCQLADWKRPMFVGSNRGVSGIDGCTSTAVGLAATTDRTVLLVSGDMGAAYDVAALSAGIAGPNFKMAVLDNGGGDIFRHVATTASLPERERLFAVPPVFPLEKLADAYGFAYFRASTAGEATEAVRLFMAEDCRPSILHILTEPENNQTIYDTLFKRNKK
ncbi:MAG: 2-succinyl-5-enolpyruvyl-6-hydroxy-3-cyclohexene-1-carboxylic-acid synthase [Muribaculaceae bacterium]|nr:2-succinyl-5-enolpyruvyl-6-hydroxy-3-cyclohexene-1-carboxylic-acid synthase [Muribaculaceae bacterium]